MGKFNDRLFNLFGISNRGKGRVVNVSSMTVDQNKSDKPVDPPSLVTNDMPAENATMPSEQFVRSSTVDDVALSTASVAKMMDYTYGYRLKQIDGFVVENVTKHPNLNIVMYTMLHVETNKRLKIGKDVFEMLFESAGENK